MLLVSPQPIRPPSLEPALGCHPDAKDVAHQDNIQDIACLSRSGSPTPVAGGLTFGCSSRAVFTKTRHRVSRWPNVYLYLEAPIVIGGSDLYLQETRQKM